jgi:uncharacterized protein with von Willebrand factor type A (vWA) domain
MINSAGKTDSPDFFVSLITFFRKLKQRGISVKVDQEIDCFRVLEYINIFDKADFYHSLRVILLSKVEDIAVFDQVFVSHWMAVKEDLVSEGGEVDERAPQRQTADDLSGDQKKEGSRESSEAYWGKEGLEGEESGLEGRQTFSPVERLREKDFSKCTDEELREIQKVIPLIAKQLRIRESRRKKSLVNVRRMLDFRRTMRKSVRYGGDVIRLAWKSREITKTRVILLCDISGSMEGYSRFLVQFLYGLQSELDLVETFVFGTRLSRISTTLRRGSFEKALDVVAQNVLDWSGGTRIGECLGVFNRRYAAALMYKKTIVIIISDGWDRGDENILRQEMTKLRKKAYHLIWLNPLLGSPQYKPSAIGMTTALPFVDQFLPFYNLKSLVQLGEVLHRIG